MFRYDQNTSARKYNQTWNFFHVTYAQVSFLSSTEAWGWFLQLKEREERLAGTEREVNMIWQRDARKEIRPLS